MDHSVSRRREAHIANLGQEFWTRTRPVYPLLGHLAKGQEHARHLLLTDTKERIAQALVDFDWERESRAAR